MDQSLTMYVQNKLYFSFWKLIQGPLDVLFMLNKSKY